MTVWIYVDKSKDVGDKDQLKLFANEHAANEWFKKHDVLGKAFGYEIISSDMKPHVAQAYKDACDNLIYLKKEQFQVTYYTWAVLAALYILSRALPAGDLMKYFLLAGTFLVGFVSLYVLWDFRRSVERFRERLANIYEDYFTKLECKRLGLDASRKHRNIWGILSFSVLAATSFTAWAVWKSVEVSPPNRPTAALSVPRTRDTSSSIIAPFNAGAGEAS
jgi:hypothetical protein